MTSEKATNFLQSGVRRVWSFLFRGRLRNSTKKRFPGELRKGKRGVLIHKPGLHHIDGDRGMMRTQSRPEQAHKIEECRLEIAQSRIDARSLFDAGDGIESIAQPVGLTRSEEHTSE